MSNADLKVGDEIYLSKDSQWLFDCEPPDFANPLETKGIVYRVDDYWVHVKWGTGIENEYYTSDSDLIPASVYENKQKEEEQLENIFNSRKDAREYAKNNNGKVIDRGSHLTENRWEVESKIISSIKSDMKTLKDAGFIKDNVEPSLNYEDTHVIITPQSISITLSDGSQHSVARKKDEFTKIVELAMQEKYEEMMQYVDIANAVKIFTFGTDITIKDGVLFYQGQEVHSTIAKRIVEESQLTSGNVERYINFFLKLQQNPSYKAVQHTYDFLVHNDLEIMDNGNIKAWKGVTMINGVPTASHGVPNWKDCVIEMPRNQVEDNPEVTCSYGLHVASYKYANGFGSYLLEVSFSPEDVVSVPVDENGAKMRCCKYKVLTGVRNFDSPEYMMIDKHGTILKQE